MFRSHLVRALVLGIVLTLAAQAAWAGPRQTGDVSGSARSLMAQLWHAVAASWSDVGCWIDPGGACGAEAPAPPPEAKIGCWLDPHGGCGASQPPASPPETDVGCIIDPHGGCGAGH